MSENLWFSRAWKLNIELNWVNQTNHFSITKAMIDKGYGFCEILKHNQKPRYRECKRTVQ